MTAPEGGSGVRNQKYLMKKKRSIKPVLVKRLPQRTCVACGTVGPKRQLIRLVRVPGGGVEVDPGGKKAGRGAYLCPAAECWQAGLKKGRLEHALRITLTPDNREQLLKYGVGLGKELV
jgi:predicted RNA-binding protein YlxR (DUF448 family)